MQAVEKWRYRCPRGHTGWEMTRQAFWCGECYRRAVGETGRFDRVRDEKRDELLTAPQLRGRLARERR